MDKSSQHLKDVEREIDELEKGFCMRLCCSSKSKKSKSKNLSLKKSEENKSNENFIPAEQDSIYSNQQFRNLDENLQKLQYFNTLIDHEIQDQLQTLVCFKIFVYKTNHFFNFRTIFTIKLTSMDIN
jgi:hypothetical protein